MSEPSYPSYPGTPEQAGGYPPPVPYVPVKRPHPARGLMISAIILAGVFVTLDVAEAVLSWPAQSRLLDAVEDGASLDFLTPYDAIVFTWLPVLIASYVVTCLWLYRVRVNAEILRPLTRHARRRWWVWGSWVVPFVNLGFPYQIVRDVAKDEHGHVFAPRINAWWTCWLLAILIENLGLRVINVQAAGGVPDAYSGLGFIETTSGTLTLVAFILWVRIILSISRDQDRLMGITPPVSA